MFRSWGLGLVLLICLATMPSEAQAQGKGCRFVGDPLLKPVWNDPVLGKTGKYDPGDYEMQLQGSLAYIECALTRHTVKAGTVVNGASIPRATWSILGYSPWAGPLQYPSIVHDDLCGKARFTSDRVHKIFHEALLHSEVPPLKAAIMYAAVQSFGPQWSTPGGPVTYPTYVEGTMRLIIRLLGKGEQIEATEVSVRTRRSNEYIAPGDPRGKYVRVPRYRTVPSTRRGLTGSSDGDADAVLSVLKDVKRVPTTMHDDLAGSGSPPTE
jgi:hypothetical protein